jgi:hypothetical protein
MNATVEQQDAERMSARIEALEFLVRQQKDFIEESSSTWRGLLEKEQALGAQGWRERNELDARFRALSEEQAAHDRILSAQTEAAELKAQLVDAENGRQESDRAREEAQERLDQLTDQLSKLDNMLRQRQEEIEQAWNALAEHRARVAELEANLTAAAEREVSLEQKLKDADGWVFKLAGERTDREKQLELLIRERNNATEKLAVAHKQLASLRERLGRLMAERSKPVFAEDAIDPLNAPRHSGMGDDVLQPSSGRMEQHGKLPHSGMDGQEDSTAVQPDPIRPPNVAPILHSAKIDIEKVGPAIDDLMKPVIERNKKMFLDQLIVTKGASTQASSVSSISVTEPDISTMSKTPMQKLEARPLSQTPMRMTVPARNPQLERQVKAAELDIRWLRELSLACLDMPKRWSFLPLSWHLSRIKERFDKKGLFDEQAYLSRNPDVAEASIDPLIHYLKHGMDEGRER